MQSNRNYYVRKNPTVVLDKRFKFTDSLNLGDKGHLLAELNIQSMNLVTDEDHVDLIQAKIKIESASLLVKEKEEPKKEFNLLDFSQKWEPVFTCPEKIFPSLGGRKVGQSLKAIMSYKVREKTKSFTVLEISYIEPENQKRIV